MRTTLNISDSIMNDAMLLSGISNKTKLIELALNEYLRKLKRERVKNAFGKLQFDMDIIEARKQDRHG